MKSWANFRKSLIAKYTSAHQYNATTTANKVLQDLKHQIKGKIILTTGVSPGSLGAALLETIAKAQPALLILAGRDTTKLQRTADVISTAETMTQVRLLELDLGSLAIVRKYATIVNSWGDIPCIDILVNSAGIMATCFALSPEGYAGQLATNHLGHFLFAKLIMDKILVSQLPRIVNDGYRLNPIRRGDYNFKVCICRQMSHWGLDCTDELHEKIGETCNKCKSVNLLMSISLAEELRHYVSPV